MSITYYDFSKEDLIAVDIETKDPNLIEKGTGVYRRDGYILGISFSNGELSEYYPLCKSHTNPETRDKNLKYVEDQLSADNRKIFANGLYDLDWLENFLGLPVKGEYEDVQVAEPLINEYASSYSLNSLSTKYLEQVKFSNELDEYAKEHGFKGKGINHLEDLPLSLVSRYACQDTNLTYQVYKKQEPILREQNLWDVYCMEMELYPLLLQMRKTGVRLNTEKMPQVGMKLADAKFDLQEELNTVFKGELNVNSGVHLKTLFEILNIPITYRPPTEKMLEKGVTRGNPRFDKSVLSTMSHPIAKNILDVRHITTLLNMFIKAYPLLLVGDRLHCSFHPLRSDEYGTVSGRFSSSKPNLQQVSGKDEEDYIKTDDEDLKGLIVRKLFIPEEGCDWLKLDWSQIEYRLIAHYALGQGAELIRQRYKEDPNTDYHEELGRMTNLDDRKIVKTLNFGAAYGMGIAKMAMTYGWNLGDAEQVYKMYHSKVPFVKETSRRVSQKAKRVGFIKTILGRRAHLPASNKAYVMFNRLIQGSAADIMKKAMLDSHNAGLFNVLFPHLTVHDEMDVSMPQTKEGKEAGKELIHTMENCVKLRVPIKVDAEIGKNWGSLSPWEE